MTADKEVFDALSERRPFVLEVAGVPYIVGHKDYESTSCEQSLPRPVRDDRRLTLADSASFVEYINRHGQKNTAVYVSATWPASDTPLAEAVIDDGAKGQTSWRDHRAYLSPILSKAFGDWRVIDREKVNQLTLCSFLDRHLQDIVRPEDDDKAPSAAEVYTFASQLSDVRKVEFKKSINLDNGRVQLTYNEEDTGTQNIVIPKEFYIQVKPLVGHDSTYRLKVSMRYRIEDGVKLSFTLELRDIDKLLEALRKEITDGLKKDLSASGIPVYLKA